MINSIRIPKRSYFRLEVVGSINVNETDNSVIVKDKKGSLLAWVSAGSAKKAEQLQEVLIQAQIAHEEREDYTPNWDFLDEK